jgi:hypothetical protein
VGALIGALELVEAHGSHRKPLCGAGFAVLLGAAFRTLNHDPEQTV